MTQIYVFGCLLLRRWFCEPPLRKTAYSNVWVVFVMLLCFVFSAEIVLALKILLVTCWFSRRRLKITMLLGWCCGSTFLYVLGSTGFLYENQAKSVPAVLVFVAYLELLLLAVLRSYDLRRFRLNKISAHL